MFIINIQKRIRKIYMVAMAEEIKVDKAVTLLEKSSNTVGYETQEIERKRRKALGGYSYQKGQRSSCKNWNVNTPTSLNVCIRIDKRDK